jgi:hypothetical protein
VSHAACSTPRIDSVRRMGGMLPQQDEIVQHHGARPGVFAEVLA